ILLDHAGLTYDHEGVPYLALCKTCRNSYRQKNLSPLALLNHIFISTVPPELRDLTSIEEVMIPRC
ncbi:hypothetical protein C8J56DRAFT_733112, partial [Mycena floridula]